MVALGWKNFGMVGASDAEAKDDARRAARSFAVSNSTSNSNCSGDFVGGADGGGASREPGRFFPPPNAGWKDSARASAHGATASASRENFTFGGAIRDARPGVLVVASQERFVVPLIPCFAGRFGSQNLHLRKRMQFSQRTSPHPSDIETQKCRWRILATRGVLPRPHPPSHRAFAARLRTGLFRLRLF